MDKMEDSGSSDTGSIPVGATFLLFICDFTLRFHSVSVDLTFYSLKLDIFALA